MLMHMMRPYDRMLMHTMRPYDRMLMHIMGREPLVRPPACLPLCAPACLPVFLYVCVMFETNVCVSLSQVRGLAEQLARAAAASPARLRPSRHPAAPSLLPADPTRLRPSRHPVAPSLLPADPTRLRPGSISTSPRDEPSAATPSPKSPAIGTSWSLAEKLAAQVRAGTLGPLAHRVVRAAHACGVLALLWHCRTLPPQLLAYEGGPRAVPQQWVITRICMHAMHGHVSATYDNNGRDARAREPTACVNN